MSNDLSLVTFNVRYEKSTYALKIETPSNVSEFHEKLNDELQLKSTDELVVLCPTPEGKMMEIKTDDDIEFLKKTKLCYNAVSKEIYCSVELVVVVIHKQLPDDPKAQMMILSNKVDLLTSQFDELSVSLNNQIEENTSNIIQNIRSILLEHPQKDSNISSKKVLDEQSSSNVSNLEPKIGQRAKKIKKDKEKSSSSSSNTSTTNDNPPTLSENIRANTPKDIDTLLEMLVNDGYTNTIQNIIVLKRFDNNYEQAVGTSFEVTLVDCTMVFSPFVLTNKGNKGKFPKCSVKVTRTFSQRLS